MKNLAAIVSLFILAIIVSTPAISQTTNSAAQKVTFAVHRTPQPAWNVLKALQSTNSSANATEPSMLQERLKQQTAKVTVSASNSILQNNSSNIHLNILSALDTKKSIASGRTLLVLTITE